MLGQVAVDRTSNEVGVLSGLFGMLDIRGAVVTADAMRTQRAASDLFIGRGGRHSRSKAAPCQEVREKPVSKAQSAVDRACENNMNRRLKGNACSADCEKPGGLTRLLSVSDESCGTRPNGCSADSRDASASAQDLTNSTQ